MKLPLVLVDDPRENLFDLRRLLSKRGPFVLRAIVEAVPESDAGVVSGNPTGSAGGIAAASATTAGAPVAQSRYRLVPARAKNGHAVPLFEPAGAVQAIVEAAAPPFVVVAFVSFATLPILEALHADARTRPLLKLGITGVRLDRNYNLARKLLYDGKLAYHEHSLALDQVLMRRLRSMLETGSPAPESTGSAAQGVPVGGLEKEKLAAAPPPAGKGTSASSTTGEEPS